MVGVGGVHPPRVDAHGVEALQVLPVDVARLGGKGVIHPDAAGIVHAWRPHGESALRPCLEGHEVALTVHLCISLGPGSEALPDADAHVSMVGAVHLVDHALRLLEVLVEELHGIPVVVGAPVLPVLYDAVEGYAEPTVLPYDLQQLLLALVAFAALVEAVGPQREHGRLPCEVPQLAYHAVGVAAEHEIVAQVIADLRLESQRIARVELCGRVVVPVYAVALDALEDVGIVLEVRLHHEAVLAALAHLAVLQQADAIDGFVLVEEPRLAHAVAPPVGTFGYRCEGMRTLCCQGVALGIGEGDSARGLVDGDAQSAGGVGHDVAAAPRAHLHVPGLGRHHEVDVVCRHLPVGCLKDAHCLGREECHVLCGQGLCCE